MTNKLIRLTIPFLSAVGKNVFLRVNLRQKKKEKNTESQCCLFQNLLKSVIRPRSSICDSVKTHVAGHTCRAGLDISTISLISKRVSIIRKARMVGAFLNSSIPLEKEREENKNCTN